MKQLLAVLFLLALSFSFTHAQIVDPEKVAKKQGTKRTNRKIEKGIDKGFDKLEEGLGRLFGKKKKKKKTSKKSEQNSNQDEQVSGNTGYRQNGKTKSPTIVWNKFDFVPGDKVIFEDGPNIMEENGEFPSRWDLIGGVTEVAQVDGENVIMFFENSHNQGIIPYLKNSNNDYLPDVFTIEFDAHFNPNIYNERYYLSFYDRKNQRSGNNKILTLYVNKLTLDKSEKNYPGKNRGNRDDIGGWRHISVAFTKGKLKAYMDDTRLINIPHYEANPTGISIVGISKDLYIKNFRIAKGGVKYYDRILQDGKIICNGIRFDTGKSTIKPESMGAINKIFQLMQKQTDLNFSIEGHTDSDGDDDKNINLSKARGKAVLDLLVEMGIFSNRLKSTGFGESKPIDNNNTSEGKANNRRVEFVKFTGETSSNASMPATNSGNSAYYKINASNIDKEFDKLSSEFYTPISGPNGIVNGAGTIFLFFTSERNLGKMEILDVDKNNNYKLTIKYKTYNQSGETVSESDLFEIEGTFAFDLDKGNAGDVSRTDQDFILKIGSKTNSSFALGGDRIAIRKYQ
ncbi:OmpA family protein [Ancylomarina sp. DW003]|nr:OmpA family protein [Ancylomarina sp. DW003]MDE5421324.1 OmpA family protein [Ancylomarina sp. DW003]